MSMEEGSMRTSGYTMRIERELSESTAMQGR